MTIVEFKPWPKTPRLYRDCVITEKIDGTNGAIGIVEYDGDWTDAPGVIVAGINEPDWLVYAQSRNRIITPEADNYGFAQWVWANAHTLPHDLGPGLHYGEWWGKGIQRGYGMDGKQFSLFNAHRWDGNFGTHGLGVVPVLYEGEYNDKAVEATLSVLHDYGSIAADHNGHPAEGVCVYHKASGQMFKVLLENDNLPKSMAA